MKITSLWNKERRRNLLRLVFQSLTLFMWKTIKTFAQILWWDFDYFVFSLTFATVTNMEQFEQLLTCCVCLDRYRNPKLLPCQHSFCMEPCMDGKSGKFEKISLRRPRKNMSLIWKYFLCERMLCKYFSFKFIVTFFWAGDRFSDFWIKNKKRIFLIYVILKGLTDYVRRQVKCPECRGKRRKMKENSHKLLCL